MRPTRNEILIALRAFPAGITTAALAAAMNTTPGKIATNVSKLAAYGQIDKLPLPGNKQALLWKAKTAT